MSVYEKRIIGYVDILGWKSACCDLSKDEILLRTVKSIEKYASSFSEAWKDTLKNMFINSTVVRPILEQHASIEFSFFSDNFAVSAPVEHAEMIFRILAWATIHNIFDNTKKFLVRGGVTFGDLYHKNNVIFGPALIEAVDLEKKAKYPRLLCSKTLVEFLDQTNYKDKVILLDRNQDWIANTAFIGSPWLFHDFNKIIDDEINKLEDPKYIEKWQYFRETLLFMNKSAKFID